MVTATAVRELQNQHTELLTATEQLLKSIAEENKLGYLADHTEGFDNALKRVEAVLGKIKPASKTIKVKRIVLDRVEGLTSECGEEIASDWGHADLILTRWARTAPEPGQGYDKVDFKIEWEDGEVYEGRYDMNREGEDNERGQDVARHVRQFLGYMVHKLACPYFKNLPARLDDKQVEEAYQFIRKYLPLGENFTKTTYDGHFWCCKKGAR